MNKKTIMFAALMTAMPFLASAAQTTGVTTIGGGLQAILGWVGILGKIIISLTVVAFFWGLFQFVFNEEKRDDGKYLMGWSLVAIFIMSSLWGIIGFMQTTTGTDGNDAKINTSELLITE